MSITQTVFVPENRRISIEVPIEVPSGQVILTFTPQPGVQTQKKDRVPGCVKGQVWMADDFNAPLEDLKGYM